MKKSACVSKTCFLLKKNLANDFEIPENLYSQTQLKY